MVSVEEDEAEALDEALVELEALLDAELLGLADFDVGVTTGVLGLRVGLAEWPAGCDECTGSLGLLLCPDAPPVAPVPRVLPEPSDPVLPDVAPPEAGADADPETDAEAEALAEDEGLASGSPAGSVDPALCEAVVPTFWSTVPVLAPACWNAPIP